MKKVRLTKEHVYWYSTSSGKVLIIPRTSNWSRNHMSGSTTMSMVPPWFACCQKERVSILRPWDEALHPTIAHTDITYALRNQIHSGVCSNFTSKPKVRPYLLPQVVHLLTLNSVFFSIIKWENNVISIHSQGLAERWNKMNHVEKFWKSQKQHSTL